MEIKVNSKENPSVFQAIPMIFQGFSTQRRKDAKTQIQGFPKDAKPDRRTPQARGPAARRTGTAMTDRDGSTSCEPSLTRPSPAPEGMLKSGLLSLAIRSVSRRRHSAIFAGSPLKSHGDLRYAPVETGRNKVVVSTKNVQTGINCLLGGAVTICAFGACRSSSDRAYILCAIT